MIFRIYVGTIFKTSDKLVSMYKSSFKDYLESLEVQNNIYRIYDPRVGFTNLTFSVRSLAFLISFFSRVC